MTLPPPQRRSEWIEHAVTNSVGDVMPPGRTHDLVNATVFASSAVGLTLLHAATGETLLTQQEILAFTGGFVAGTLWLSPDLDKAGTLPKKRWGPLGVLWAPYTAAFKHRGLSHGYVVGPLTRLLYLGLLLSPLAWFPSSLSWLLAVVASLPANWWVWVLVGYYLASWSHLVADKVRLKL